MTSRPSLSIRHAALFSLALLPGLGCTTVVPVQTASTVGRGTWRVGGQAALSPWCGLSGDVANRCASRPEGTPLPEVRLQGRTGVAEGMDVGVSLSGAAHVPAERGLAVRGGVYVDGKRELFSRALGGERRQVLSVAPGAGLSLAPVSPRGGLAPEVDLALPVFFGHQTEGWEWVAGAQVLERLRWSAEAADPEQRFRARTELGVSVGAFSRAPARTAWQLSYVTPVDRPDGGRLTLGFGLVFDVTP
jgi:hypothetical protein